MRAKIPAGYSEEWLQPRGHRSQAGGLRTHGFQLTESPGVWAMGALVRGEDFAIHGYPSLAQHAHMIVEQWN